MSEITDEDILAYDMFAADRDSNVTPLSDKMVTTRKPHYCVICLEVVPVGSRCRAKTERDNDDRRVMTFYACPTCCAAMALSWKDCGQAIEDRTAIGMGYAKDAFHA